MLVSYPAGRLKHLNFSGRYNLGNLAMDHTRNIMSTRAKMLPGYLRF